MNNLQHRLIIPPPFFLKKRDTTVSSGIAAQQVAHEAKLRYVSDKEVGITRIKKGKYFFYYLNKIKICDSEQIGRINKLAIPPAWRSVWICQLRNGHLQATGVDTKNRKQYRYHATWNSFRSETKFHKLLQFGKVLPLLRKKIKHDINGSILTKEKVLAMVMSVMEQTSIRIGNDEYEKLYGSFGLTTFKDGHVKIEGAQMKFSFKGKKGVKHSILLKSKRLAKIVKACKDIPGKQLFQFLNSDGSISSIDSGMLNNYIKEGTKGDFSAKDFRTWAGSLSILNSLRSAVPANLESQKKRNLLIALDEVSNQLGNTRTVCKNYYVHPGIIRLYQEDNLQKYLTELDQDGKCKKGTDLTGGEKVLMKILKKL